MSSHLWRAYFENDLDKFRSLLGLQDGHDPPGTASAGLSATLTPPLQRKLPATPNFRVEQQLLKTQINSRLPPGVAGAITSGITLLHHAATNNNLPFVQALLSHPLVDVLTQDFESGWTALHKSLYFGNISAARLIMSRPGNEVVKVKDKEGNSPFELFFSTIGTCDMREDDIAAQEDEDEDLENIKKEHIALEAGVSTGEYLGDEVWIWGSNKNVSLGFADGDDRQYPERAFLALPHTSNLAIDVFNPVLVQDVQMSKLQTSILTNAPTGNLFTCGFGHGGRLGLGQDSTEFSFKQVPIEGRVQTIILGQDHTIAIVGDGDVYTWGSGKWGQLGYAVKAAKPDEDPCQPTPRQVYTTLRKEKVIGGAASKWHSVVHTVDGLYVFGKNEGQLGIVDADSRTLEVQTTPRRVSASLVTADIIMVTVTDTATAVLYSNHEVWVFANYGYAKVTFPFDRFPNTNIRITRPVLRHNTPNYISKIVSGGETIAALSQMGDVFTINTDKVYGTGSRAFMTSQRIWSLKKKHMAVRDVDVGQAGSVILCTESGSVWQRVKRSKDVAADRAKDYKFSRVPGLTHIVAVRSSAFGAFAAVRRDVDSLKAQLQVREGTLRQDMKGLLSFKSAFDDLAWFAFEHIAERLSRDLEEVNFSNYDAFIETGAEDVIRIPVHSVILAGRSPKLRSIVGKGRSLDFVQVRRVGEGVIIRFPNVDILTILILVFYLYTDVLVSPWHIHGQSKTRTSKFQEARAQIRALAQSLGLTELEYALSNLRPPRNSLHVDLEKALEAPTFRQCADITLQLKNGTMDVHSPIMCARCPFFEALYRGGSSRWLLSRRESEGLIQVDMKHITVEVMRIVLVYIYSDKSVGLFDQIAVDESGISGFLDLLVDVISAANELMLERLSEICQRVLGRFVNTRNVTSLLMSTADCSVSGFKDACYDYICMNLETMLETHILDELEEDLMAELDDAVRERQLAYMPIVRSGKVERDLFERYPELEAQCLEEREHALGLMSSSIREDSPVSSFKAKAVAPRHRRRPSKDAVVRPDASDMMFDMDDVQRGSLSSSPIEVRAKAKGSPPREFPPPEAPVAAREPSSPTSPTTSPWKATSAFSSKLDMKEIMAQASKTHMSSLSLGLASPPLSAKETPKAAKMSQKERKRQAREPEPAPVPVPVTPERPAEKASPWKTPVSVPKMSLKDIMVPVEPKSADQSPIRIPPKVQKPPQPVPLSPKQIRGPTPSVRGVKQQSTPTTPQPRAYIPSSPTSSRRPSLNPRQTSPTSCITTYYAPQRAVSDPSFPPLGVDVSAAHLSLSEIISQQQLEQDIIRGKLPKPNLQDIQQEQEFLSWWDKESERYQAEAQAARHEEERQSRGKGRGRARKGRGRGGAEAAKGAKQASGEKGDENKAVEGRRGKSRGRGDGSHRGRRGQGKGAPMEKAGRVAAL